jgi:hypothetical protein
MKSFGKRAISIACVVGLPAWAAETETSESSASWKNEVANQKSDASDPRTRSSSEVRVLVATGAGALAGLGLGAVTLLMVDSMVEDPTAAGGDAELLPPSPAPTYGFIIGHAVGTALGVSITTSAFGVGSSWAAALGVLPGYVFGGAMLAASGGTSALGAILFFVLPPLSGALFGEWFAAPPAPAARHPTSAAVLPFVSPTRGGAIAGAIGRF